MVFWSFCLKKNDFKNEVSHADLNSLIFVGIISSLLSHLFLNPLEKKKKDKGERQRDTKITSFLLIKLTLEKVEYICGQMDFLIVSPHAGCTSRSGQRQKQTTAGLHTREAWRALLLCLPWVWQPSRACFLCYFLKGRRDRKGLGCACLVS